MTLLQVGKSRFIRHLPVLHSHGFFCIFAYWEENFLVDYTYA